MSELKVTPADEGLALHDRGLSRPPCTTTQGVGALCGPLAAGVFSYRVRSSTPCGRRRPRAFKATRYRTVGARADVQVVTSAKNAVLTRLVGRERRCVPLACTQRIVVIDRRNAAGFPLALRVRILATSKFSAVGP